MSIPDLDSLCRVELAVRIERRMGDRNSEASYGMQLRKRFPDARETQLLLRGE